VLNLIATAQQAGPRLDELRNLLPQDLSQWEHGTLAFPGRTWWSAPTTSWSEQGAAMGGAIGTQATAAARDEAAGQGVDEPLKAACVTRASV
jgi:hypothetical protein